MTPSPTALRLWDAVCEMRAADHCLIKDAFCRRVDEILSTQEASVEIKPTPTADLANRLLVDAVTARPEEGTSSHYILKWDSDYSAIVPTDLNILFLMPLRSGRSAGLWGYWEDADTTLITGLELRRHGVEFSDLAPGGYTVEKLIDQDGIVVRRIPDENRESTISHLFKGKGP